MSFATSHGALRTLASAAALAVSLLAAPVFADDDAPEAEPLAWSALIPEGWAPQAPDMTGFFGGHSGGPAAQASVDVPVVDSLDGKRVTLEGWLVPLEIERAERYHEFLLVPYFGACYHVPPPPPNQTVHLFVEDGVAHELLWEPQSITGRMQIDRLETALATAAYRIEDATATVAEW